MEKNTQKLRIGILTTFYDWKKTYSLVSVAEEQLLSLLENGYSPVLFVLPSFKDDDKIPAGVEIRKVIPQVTLVDYANFQPIQDGFQAQVDSIKLALEEHMQDIDVALTHDWIFTGWFLPYNAGMRAAQPKLKCRWLHWAHSAPSTRPANLVHPHTFRYSTMANSKLIYMNNHDPLRLAEMYGTNLDSIRVVYNPLDLRSFLNLSPLTKKIVDDNKLLESEIVVIYPLSMPRAVSGKQLDKVIWVLGEIRKLGKTAKLVVCNSHSNAKPEKESIKKLHEYAKKCGLQEGDLIFTSEIKDTDKFPYEDGVPHETIRELFQISNVFIFPTISENCPLVLLEAAAAKNLLVLNESFAPLRDFFGKDALYFTFGAKGHAVEYPDEDKWYSDVARVIIAELNKNKVINSFNTLRMKFNRNWIFQNQLMPLFFEKFDA